ncbi:MAG: polysaccharide pyruvyl transferase family protein, partial [Bacteroidota bacterium]
MKCIFLTGLTSSTLGGMEFGNLGNYAVIEPFIEGLKKEFPDHQIYTTIQLSDKFCSTYQITSLRNPRFYTYGFATAKETINDFIRLFTYKYLGWIFASRKDLILLKSALLKNIHQADFVIDFSGDVFGDNAKYNVFLEGVAKIIISKGLGKKVFMVASSPGPFNKFWQQLFGLKTLRKVSLIINREDISSQRLLSYGLSSDKVITTACPSFNFTCDYQIPLDKYCKIKPNLPTVGIIISGWNMPEDSYHKVPRKKEELTVFLKLIEHIHNTYECNVVLMSHAHKFQPQTGMKQGNDFYISKQLFEEAQVELKSDRLFLFEEILEAKDTKAIISNLDFLVSGRLHGAVSGFSQYIPTLVVNYGNGPKPLKLKGFVDLIGVPECLCEPNNLNQLKTTFDELWNNKEAY